MHENSGGIGMSGAAKRKTQRRRHQEDDKKQQEREIFSKFSITRTNFMGVFSPADILAGIGGLSPLNEQIRSCHFALFGYDWNSPTRWVVIYFLSAVAERFFLLNKLLLVASETNPICIGMRTKGRELPNLHIHYASSGWLWEAHLIRALYT